MLENAGLVCGCRDGPGMLSGAPEFDQALIRDGLMSLGTTEDALDELAPDWDSSSAILAMRLLT